MGKGDGGEEWRGMEGRGMEEKGMEGRDGRDAEKETEGREFGEDKWSTRGKKEDCGKKDFVFILVLESGFTMC